MNKAKECLWYDGEGAYHLLDFDPNGLTDDQILDRAKVALEIKGLLDEKNENALETVYLIDVDTLKRVQKEFC